MKEGMMERRTGAYQPPALKYEFVIGDRSRVFYIIKRTIDILVVVIGLILLTPIILAVAAAVATTGMPILFRQVRLGQGGRPFTLIKFRTMRPTASPYAPKPDLVAKEVTRVGRFLRLTGLDEIPQLVNVLLGQMTLVGPRPEMPFIVESYDWVQRLRLDARPGVTGLWQLSLVRLEPIHQHVEYDLFYLAHRSL
ncbi:MAG TPA: sugar transferase, partial [Opitutaceae bacterium]